MFRKKSRFFSCTNTYHGSVECHKRDVCCICYGYRCERCGNVVEITLQTIAFVVIVVGVVYEEVLQQIIPSLQFLFS